MSNETIADHGVVVRPAADAAERRGGYYKTAAAAATAKDGDAAVRADIMRATIEHLRELAAIDPSLVGFFVIDDGFRILVRNQRIAGEASVSAADWLAANGGTP